MDVSGRPPWYDVSGETMQPFIIGIAGGSASGKTTVAQYVISHGSAKKRKPGQCQTKEAWSSFPLRMHRAIIEELGVRWVVLMSMDSFYKALTPEQKELAAKGEYNFDHPGLCTYLSAPHRRPVNVHARGSYSLPTAPSGRQNSISAVLCHATCTLAHPQTRWTSSCACRR
jgi:hypothetical protein